MAVCAWYPCLTPHGNSVVHAETYIRVFFFCSIFATHELLVSVHHSLSYILAIFLVFFQLMAKHAIDYNVFGGPQNFGKWMDVHSAPSCPTEVIKDIYLWLPCILFDVVLVTVIWLVTVACCFVHRRGHLLSI